MADFRVRRRLFIVLVLIFAGRGMALAQGVESISPKQAYEMSKNPGTYIVDVRTVAEYVWVGHPETAYNVPLAFWDDLKAGTTPNADFLSDLKARFKPEDVLIFICRAGGRSQRASNMAQNAGFLKVYNVIEGFEGGRDAKGLHTVGGWKGAGLPYTLDVNPELAYKPKK